MWQILEGANVDLVILDIMLPGSNGLDLCREIRSRSALPVIMLTAKGEEIELLEEVGPLVHSRGTLPTRRWLAIRPLRTERRFVRTSTLRFISPAEIPSDPALVLTVIWKRPPGICSMLTISIELIRTAPVMSSVSRR